MEFDDALGIIEGARRLVVGSGEAHDQLREAILAIRADHAAKEQRIKELEAQITQSPVRESGPQV